MKTSLAELLAKIPGAPSAQWPQGERYALGLSHGTMSFGLYAPTGSDPQQPHKRDELYIIESGRGELVIGEETHAFDTGQVFFVAAGVEHRFVNFSPDFRAWVVFWGPPGGERTG